MKKLNFFHRGKEFLLGCVVSRDIKKRTSLRILGLFLLLILLPFTIGIINWYTADIPLVHTICFSASHLFFCIFAILCLCKIDFFQRSFVKNCIFIFTFLIGILSCCLLADKIEKSNVPSPPQKQQTVQTVDKGFWQDCFSAIHNSHIAMSAFFPSRGEYEVKGDGNFMRRPLKGWTFFFYILFHAGVYIFAGYFLVSLWGYRTINRLQFWLTRDCEKNVFWCHTPEPKMLKLANDILQKSPCPAQPVFTVEEVVIRDKKFLFHEMNFQNFCLKMRKPEQIHSSCLRASKHFFLSEDSDWNMNMARALLQERKQKNIQSFAELYIRISDDSRELFFNRWADANNEPGRTELILIDECEMIAEKFVAEYPMLDTIDSQKIVPETATVAGSEFKVLVIGFGRLGRAILRHMICDCQFLDAKKENIIARTGITGNSDTYSPDHSMVPFSADIIDCDDECWTIFENNHRAACERFHLNFIPMKVFSRSFYELKWENLKNYNRIIVALGDEGLNIEVTAAIEKLIRKSIPLPSVGNPVENPAEILAELRKKFFLVSPEINSHSFDIGSKEKSATSLFSNQQNLFTLIGANYEIYCFDHIIREKLSFMAKLIDLAYNIKFSQPVSSAQQEAREAHNALRRQYDLPVIPSDYTFEDVCSKLKDKHEIEHSWYTCSPDGKKLQSTTMYSRKSSRAAAANMKNMLRLVGLDETNFFDQYKIAIRNSTIKTNLSKTEHLRWMAFMLLEGHDLWKDPQPVNEWHVSSANQTKQYFRHATLVEWEALPELEPVFHSNFREKDLEIIENLELIYKEYLEQQQS